MTRRYRCRACDHEFAVEEPIPPAACPNPDCTATFRGGWSDDLVRLQ